jgi:Right handed beta helix region
VIRNRFKSMIISDIFLHRNKGPSVETGIAPRVHQVLELWQTLARIDVFPRPVVSVPCASSLLAERACQGRACAHVPKQRLAVAGACLALAFTLVLSAAQLTHANDILVTSVAEFDAAACTLRGAIINHNHHDQSGSILCAKGSDNDVILLTPFTAAKPFSADIYLNSPLPPVESGTLNLKKNSDFYGTFLYKPTTLHGAYFQVNAGATLIFTDQIDITAGLDLDYATDKSLIYVNGGTLILGAPVGQTFMNNGKKPPKYGGAIYNEGGSISIGSDTMQHLVLTLRDNAATTAGGAIYNHRGTIKGWIKLFGNSAPLGGAIYNDGGNISLRTSAFVTEELIGNKALDGGCIFTHEGFLTLDGIICNDSQSPGQGRGSGLFADGDSNVVITNSTFNNNHEGDQNSGGRGGAIFIDQGAKLKMSGTTCSNNSALAGGCLWTSSSNVTLDKLTCTGNSAQVGGCAEINADHGILTVRDSSISDNKTSNGGLGGAVAVRNSTLSLSNTRLSANTADRGGAVFLDPDAAMKAEILACEANISDMEGGCIFGDGILKGAAAAITLDKSRCDGNSSYDGGCLDTPRGGTVTIRGSQITRNKASFGGGLLVQRGSQVVIGNSTITGNDAAGSPDSVGGGMFAFDHTDVTMTGSTLNDNLASKAGAGMQFENFSSLTAVNDTFANEGPVEKPAHGIHFVDSYANLISTTFYSAPLSIEGGVTGDLRNSILYNSNACLGELEDGHFNVQSPAPPDVCRLDSIEIIPKLEDLKLDSAGLKDNGGPSKTVAELPVTGSPTIDQIPLMMCTDQDGKPLKVDQRGFPRPDPYGDKALCDIGAYEYQAPKP